MSMFGNLSLTANSDGTYDLIIKYDRNHGEFGLDFILPGGLSEGYQTVKDYLSRLAKGVKVRSAKIMISGLVVLALPITAMLQASAASSHYSMTYLYIGSHTQQVAEVVAAQSGLDTVSPFYFDLNSDGNLIFNRPAAGTLDELQGMGMRVVPFLSNRWDQEVGMNALDNAEILVDEIVSHIEEYELDGINADIENLTPAYRDAYSDFIALLRERIPANKEVSVAVAANPDGRATGWHGSYDYAALAQHADYLMLMTYDEHCQGSEPGPVASIDFVENSIRYALSYASPDQIVVGLPFFGRIWGGNGTFDGNYVPLNQVDELIELYCGTTLFDENVQSPVATFTIGKDDFTPAIDGRALQPGDYHIWFENDQSIMAKLALVDEYGLKGTSSWTLGQQTDSVWNVYESWINGL